MINFQCQKCGECCRVLRDSIGEVSLKLFPFEKEFFPEEIVKPYVAFGEEKDVLMYQMIIEPCPMLTDNGCKIYEHRPLICRHYPLKIDWNNNRQLIMKGFCLHVKGGEEFIYDGDKEIKALWDYGKAQQKIVDRIKVDKMWLWKDGQWVEGETKWVA